MRNRLVSRSDAARREMRSTKRIVPDKRRGERMAEAERPEAPKPVDVAREGYVSITGCAIGTKSSISFTERRRDMGIHLFTGSVGDRFDNAMRESFLATLECTPIDRRSFRTRAQGRMAVSELIERCYDPRRRPSALGHDSPMIYERRLKSAPSPETENLSTRSGQLHTR